MPETPDFDQIAHQMLQIESPNAGFVSRRQAIAEQLRLVWNARGAADLATIDATITYTLSMSDVGLMTQLDRAIRILDR